MKSKVSGSGLGQIVLLLSRFSKNRFSEERQSAAGASSQHSLVVASHGEQPLQGVGGVRVLHGALGLQVADERQHGLQQMLLGKLQPGDTHTNKRPVQRRGGGGDSSSSSERSCLNIPGF